MSINLEIGELEAFVAVAEKGSFKAAAEGLFLSQPALSRRIEKLELSLQTRLLERTTRRVSLTEAGRLFLPHAEIVLEELRLALRGMAERTVLRQESITIACVPSVANHLLPLVLRDFAALFPRIRVKVIDESARQVLDSVISGQADFGINFIGTQDAAIDFRILCTENYVLAVPCGHPLAAGTEVAWDALVGETVISVSQSSGNRMLIDHAVAKLARRPAIHYEVNHVAAALGLVSAGLGVAVVPELALAKLSYPGLVGLALVAPGVTRSLGLITRKGSRPGRAARVLAEMMEAAMRRRIP